MIALSTLPPGPEESSVKIESLEKKLFLYGLVKESVHQQGLDVGDTTIWVLLNHNWTV